jgi:alpha-1,3-mannosyltransferase
LIGLAKTPMRIGHVVRQFSPARGGLEDFVANLSREQVRMGHTVRIITCNRKFQALDERLPSEEIDDGREIRRVPFFGSTRYPIAPSVLRHLGDLDVVHVHGIDFFFDYMALTAKLHNRPLVATTHGGFFHTAAHRRLKALWFNSMTKLSAARYFALVASSRSDLNRFTALGGDRLRLIENGVDLQKFANAASSSPRKCLLTLGRFSINKRLDRLLDVFRSLRAAGPAWRLEICGVPSDWSVERLNQEIRDRGLQAAVSVHADPTVDEIRRIMGGASIFVSASEYEGFGIALVEAMSAGLAPVVNANHAFTEIARLNDLVRLADFSSADDAVAAILAAFEALQTDTSLSSRLSRSVERFAWPEIAQRYVEVYEAGCSSSQRHGVPAFSQGGQGS